MSCRWCHDRPGGCLYCSDQAEHDPEGVLAELQQQLERGEIEIVQVARISEQAFVIRHNTVPVSVPINVIRPVDHGGPGPERKSPPAPAVVCQHRWSFDADNFHRRRCSRPGCGARQRFEFTPNDSTRTGTWVDVAGPVQQRQKQSTRSKSRA